MTKSPTSTLGVLVGGMGASMNLHLMIELHAKHTAQVHMDLRANKISLAELMRRHNRISPDEAVKAEARRRALAELRAYRRN